MDKRNAPEKLKIHTKFQFETLKGRGTLGDVNLDEMLKTDNVINCTIRVTIIFAFLSVKYKFSLRYVSFC